MDAKLGKSEAKGSLSGRTENFYYRLLLQDQKSLFKRLDSWSLWFPGKATRASICGLSWHMGRGGCSPQYLRQTSQWLGMCWSRCPSSGVTDLSAPMITGKNWDHNVSLCCRSLWYFLNFSCLPFNVVFMFNYYVTYNCPLVYFVHLLLYFNNYICQS